MTHPFYDSSMHRSGGLARLLLIWFQTFSFLNLFNSTKETNAASLARGNLLSNACFYCCGLRGAVLGPAEPGRSLHTPVRREDLLRRPTPGVQVLANHGASRFLLRIDLDLGLGQPGEALHRHGSTSRQRGEGAGYNHTHPAWGINLLDNRQLRDSGSLPSCVAAYAGSKRYAERRKGQRGERAGRARGERGE